LGREKKNLHRPTRPLCEIKGGDHPKKWKRKIRRPLADRTAVQLPLGKEKPGRARVLFGERKGTIELLKEKGDGASFPKRGEKETRIQVSKKRKGVLHLKRRSWGGGGGGT